MLVAFNTVNTTTPNNPFEYHEQTQTEISIKEMETVEIDASILEGGGQIFRTSISLGTILNISCHVYSIRNNRPNPGLAKQHLTG